MEEIKRPVLQIRGEQRQALALPLRKRGGGKRAVPNFDFVVQVQLDEVVLRLPVEVRVFQAQQVFEDEEVRKHGGEMLAVVVPVLVANRVAVQPNLARLWWIKAAYEVCGGRFCAARCAHQ